MTELPKGWGLVSLRKVVKSIQNGLYKSSEFYGTGHPFVRMYNLQKDSWLLDLDKLAYVEASADEVEKYRLEKGDILINRVNSIDLLGKSAWVGDESKGYVFENMLIRLKIQDDVVPIYVAQELNSDFVRAQIQRFAKRAGGQASINSEDILSIRIPLPPLAEQRKIAAILGTWDEAIATVEQLIAGLERRKQGLMQRLLTGQVRFPEFVGSEWRQSLLGDLLKPVSRSEAVQADKEYRLIGVRWYLQGAHIHNVISGDAIITKNLSRIREGDVLYNKMWVSKNAFAVAKKEHDGAYGSGEYPQFRVKKGLNVRFLEYAFHNPRFLHDATSLCRGTTGRIRLHPDDFLKLTLLLPTEKEQAMIADVLQSHEEEVAKAWTYLENLQAQKKGLMQRLLTGQVRVAV